MSARLKSMLLALSLLTAVAAQAQDEEAAAPTAPSKPRAAEIAGLAGKALLLGIARAGDQIVAVGDRGNILLSADGRKWEQVPVPVNVTLTAVSFADDKNGWAVGHDAAILRTTDGGRSWALQHFDSTLGQPALNVLALDANRAMVIGAYAMWFTTSDGGKTWSEVTAPPIRDDGLHLNALIKLGDGSLFIAGETGLIGVSADGVTWERLTLPYEGSLFGALPRGEKGALVFGLRGNVLVTDDVRSNTWKPVDIGSVQSLYGGAVLAQGRSVLVGADGEIVYIDADGEVRRAPRRDDAQGSNSGGSLSGALPWRDGLQLVGESGTGRASIPQ